VTKNTSTPSWACIILCHILNGTTNGERETLTGTAHSHAPRTLCAVRRDRVLAAAVRSPPAGGPRRRRRLWSTAHRERVRAILRALSLSLSLSLCVCVLMRKRAEKHLVEGLKITSDEKATRGHHGAPGRKQGAFPRPSHLSLVWARSS
jgi:hypothetical protein